MNRYEINGVYLSGMIKRDALNAIRKIKRSVILIACFIISTILNSPFQSFFMIENDGWFIQALLIMSLLSE